MTLGWPLFLWSLLTALVAALSFGPSFAHVLESVPRIQLWSPELWRETTVFNQQYRLFAVVGAPVDLLAIITPAVLTLMLRGQSPAFGLALAATVLFAAALIAWIAIVLPANNILATWKPGPMPENFETIRRQWETGHMVVAAAKSAGLVALFSALLTIQSSP
ncbi:hypothetical protein [Kumtagia ephedrae]|uniref:DUF1772 domain-containing protein n=1 Tax=Kumtagia ephedrae TaxID=2116701 RepID=A0A2P7RZK5_9HYPH|nr:hypothetical protein [Mesorhizobium ephedrae]PSJ55667.1 hypothetical protein C7I84_22620 [Mesorhizobium ephedrae]